MFGTKILCCSKINKDPLKKEEETTEKERLQRIY
jgi:hypothetical protein